MPAHVPIPAAVFARRPLAYAAKHTGRHLGVKGRYSIIDWFRLGHEDEVIGRRIPLLSLPLGPALGSPVWHGVSGSPRERNCVERSLPRGLPSSPHSQPESAEEYRGQSIQKDAGGVRVRPRRRQTRVQCKQREPLYANNHLPI